MINALELKNLNMVELTTSEQEELNGGIICIVLSALFVLSVYLGLIIGRAIWG